MIISFKINTDKGLQKLSRQLMTEMNASNTLLSISINHYFGSFFKKQIFFCYFLVLVCLPTELFSQLFK